MAKAGLRGPRAAAAGAVLAALAALVVGGCGSDDSSDTEGSSAPFRPRATLEAVGGTSRTDKPELVLRVTTRPGDANIRSVAVNLPPVVLVDTTAVGRICSEKELESNGCADSNRLGFARAVSPAYDAPLTGPVYVVSGSGQLPGLAYLLSGPADVRLRGRVVSKGGRMQAGVDDVPDTPLKSFELRIEGGREGYLVLSRNICGAQAVADGTFTSHDDQTHRQKIPLDANCGG
jgi:hypothetical protein